MPVSTMSKAKAGERGAENAGGSVSNSNSKRPKTIEGFTAAERCAERLARESEAERYARDDRDLTLGEQVIRNQPIQDAPPPVAVHL